ncbi:major capsid protein [Chitiniphilus eburneus]|uniref:major capsid protein n=1 Tax=Chitiniphilus eburneus TaxID=2571148 RepID=UPI0035CFF808
MNFVQNVRRYGFSVALMGGSLGTAFAAVDPEVKSAIDAAVADAKATGAMVIAAIAAVAVIGLIIYVVRKMG